MSIFGGSLPVVATAQTGIPSITTKGSTQCSLFLWNVFRLHDTKPQIGSDLRWYGKGRGALNHFYFCEVEFVSAKKGRQISHPEF